VRVIAGAAKGIRLGRVPRGVRPVSDRAREGLFSSLGDAVVGVRALDAFAGSGALGIEALSRGAERVRFVDQNRASVEAIRDNLERTGLGDRAEVELGEATAVVTRERNPDGDGYGLVFADPPYADPPEIVERLLAVLADGRLAPGWTCVVTRPTRSSTLVIPLHWTVSRRLEYGDTAVLILREA
jgi:16S rRNA (guanine966-N2)-methyltransferase